MKNLYRFILFFTCAILIASCQSIDLVKRKYRPGFYVQGSVFHAGPKEQTTALNIEPRTLHIEHNTPDIEHRTLHIEHSTPDIEPRTLHIEHRTPDIEHRTLNIEHRTLRIQEDVDVKEGSSSFALSLAGIMIMAICWTFSYPVLLIMAGLGFLLTIVGIVFAARVLNRHPGEYDYPGRRSAVTGLVLGIVGASLGLALVLVLGIVALQGGFQ